MSAAKVPAASENAADVAPDAAAAEISRLLPERFWRCACGGHVLGVSFYAWREDPPDWFIEIYEMPGRTSWRWRIRQALNILVDRDVVLDSVLLDRWKAAELVEWITASVKEVEGDGSAAAK